MYYLAEGPPTQDDIKLIKDAWYGARYCTGRDTVTAGGKFNIVDWDAGTKYGCIAFRNSDKTYWYIRDLWGTYRKWLGPVIPFEVVPERVEVTRYVRKN